MSGTFDFDVLVVGSGFGGSVTALRLTEKGYRVGVLEAGARFADEDLPTTSWDLRRYLFRPEAGCYGIQRIDALKDCMIVSGAGVGGGSLVYANTSTSRSRRSTTTRSGATSPTGAASSRRTTTRPSGCSGWCRTRSAPPPTT